MRIPLVLELEGSWSFQRMLRKLNKAQLGNWVKTTLTPTVLGMTMDAHIDTLEERIDNFYELVDEQILESLTPDIQALVPGATLSLEWDEDDYALTVTRNGVGKSMVFNFESKPKGVLDITGPGVDAFVAQPGQYARLYAAVARDEDHISRIINDFNLDEAFHTGEPITHGYQKLHASMYFTDPLRETTKADLKARQQVRALQGLAALPQDVSFAIGEYLGMQPNTAERSRPLPPALTTARLAVPYEERLAEKEVQAKRNLYAARTASAAAATTRKPLPFASNVLKPKGRRTRRQRARRS